MAIARAVIAAVHLTVVLPGLANGAMTARELPKIDTVLGRGHERAPRCVDFVVTVCLCVAVDVVLTHVFPF